ncbi:hypothetical protein [Rothia nasimurium]|uniref:hypothetical protein n=1 Tax=Rothia nasimurium TaxID=85336 RepID=UPI001624F4D2|nr:hypothetical protein [Rothia nasimurium]
MTSQMPKRLIFNTGTTTLALLLAAGMPASNAAPLPEESTSTLSHSTSPVDYASATPTLSETGAVTPTKAVESIFASDPATQDISVANDSSADITDVPAAIPTADDQPAVPSETTPLPSTSPTEAPADPIDLKVKADTADVKPGEIFKGSVENVPESTHITASLIPAQELEADPVECSVSGESPVQTFECAVPEEQKTGKYTLEIRLLDDKNQPVLVNGAEVIDTLQSVVVADGTKEYSPLLVVQYPITAAGYVMPVAGGGYEPNSEVLVSALDENNNPIPGITFATWAAGSTPSAGDLDSATGTLKVTTDADGFFNAYLITSPYMTSATVNVVAQDEKNQISASDQLGVLGESVAKLGTSVDSIVAGEDAIVEISGDQFAPSYKDYPVTLQLVRGGEIIASQDIELSRPTGDSLWSSFEKVTLKQTASLEAGEYSIQAVVPSQDNIPVEFQGRLLASKTFNVVPAEAQPPVITDPTLPVEPVPGDPVEPDLPAEPEPVETAEPTGDTEELPLPAPSESVETIPAPITDPTEAQVTPVIEQEKAPEPTETPIEQNPTWIQTSSIKAEDPRVVEETNQQLKSSVLNAQGTKNIEGRINPQAGVVAPEGANTANGATAVVNLNKSTPKWPVLLLILIALGVGAITGVSIAKTARATDSKR